MSDIFKVSILNRSNGIDKIYVFYCSKKLHDGASEVSPTEYFKMEPNSEPFENVFTKEELESINKNSIDVEFVNISIRLDDSIEEIKRKIITVEIERYKNNIVEENQHSERWWTWRWSRPSTSWTRNSIPSSS